MPFLLIFIIVPIIELAVLIQVGGLIGVLPTIAIIFVTAILGVRLLKQQGAGVLLRAQQKMQEGGLPASELAEGFLLALAGALLLTPGFVTDAFGFALLVPAIRHSMIGNVTKFIKPKVMMGGGFGQGPQGGPQSSPFEGGQADPFGGRRPQREQPSNHRPEVIEGEYRRED
ncbi:FxsA family protein [Oceanobacter kriegii]|uniref:FxsA family protein n=1 Tax=Oceanobacter kriegii TaxID=64972 RepID=UPI000404B1A5|nr:FxsA family protein [Oceanobacter kriegii]